jgi:rhamnogalacturonan endolyase
MQIKPLIFFLFALLTYSANSQNVANGKLIFSEDFSNKLDSKIWMAEIAPVLPASVYTKDGQLFLDTKGGVTVWLNKKLTGNIRIEYSRKVLIDTGQNDRLSDFNTFWMAGDPKNTNLFTRNGVLESYDSLQLYYVGMGGNTNKTTRFRKYEGNGQRTLLKEYTDSVHLLQPNKSYTITVEVNKNIIRYIVDGETWFEYNDPSVLREGYFGFRSTKSRQAIDWIKVYQLE